MCLVKTITILLLASTIASSHDLIIDKQGNEFQGVVVKIENGILYYNPDSTKTDSLIKIQKSDIFMVKYADGRKDVASVTNDHRIQDPLVSSRRLSIALQGQFGTFGLFNVDNVFTKGDYTLGLTPYLDMRLSNIFSMGTECMLLFAKPKTKDVSRFIVNPNIRGKASFAIHPTFTLEAIVAGGASIWPKTVGISYIDSTFLEARAGWNARAALCSVYIVNPRWSLVLDIGYSANSTVSREVWITHDMMLVGFGPKIRFYTQRQK